MVKNFIEQAAHICPHDLRRHGLLDLRVPVNRLLESGGNRYGGIPERSVQVKENTVCFYLLIHVLLPLFPSFRVKPAVRHGAP